MTSNRKFQENLKKYGYKYDRGKGGLIKLDGSEGPTTPVKKAATNGNKGSGKKRSAKKRKLEDAEDDGEHADAQQDQEPTESSDD